MDTKKSPISFCNEVRKERGQRLHEKRNHEQSPFRVPHAGEKINSMKYNIDARQGLSIVCHRKV